MLTPRERLMVQVSPDPDRMLWSLWAAKEAAFKSISRHAPLTIFSPVRFEVQPSRDDAPSLVVYLDYEVPIAWTQGPDWTHAWVVTSPAPWNAVEKLAGHQDASLAVRDLAGRLFRQHAGEEGEVRGRPPLVHGATLVREVSLSHDGPWVAVSLAPAPPLPL